MSVSGFIIYIVYKVLLDLSSPSTYFGFKFATSPLDFFAKNRYNCGHAEGWRAYFLQKICPPATKPAQSGGYGITVITEACGALNQGSTPCSRPR